LTSIDTLLTFGQIPKGDDMKKTVKDLLVPLSEYVIVSEELSISDALKELKEYQDNASPGQSLHRAVLVENSEGQITGKLGHHGFLKALDLKYHFLDDISAHAREEINKRIVHDAMNELGFWVHKLPAIKERASKVKMKEVVDELASKKIYEDSSLSEAMHQMVQLQVLSLLVSNKDKVIGLIRLSDLFEEISNYVLTEKDS